MTGEDLTMAITIIFLIKINIQPMMIDAFKIIINLENDIAFFKTQTCSISMRLISFGWTSRQATTRT